MIDEIEFKQIADELVRRPLQMNPSRRTCGRGRTQTFGMVRKRRTPHGISAVSRDRPYLYKMILEFADKHVSHPCTSITVNMNYRCEPHKDKGNYGMSTVVAFGNYTGGELCVEGKEMNVCNLPVTLDFSNNTHWVKEFSGERFSMVFYNCKIPAEIKMPDVCVCEIDGKYILHVNGEPVVYNKYQRSKQKQAVKLENILQKVAVFGSRVIKAFLPRARRFLKLT